MRERRTYGSVRGARSNARPYRDFIFLAALSRRRVKPGHDEQRGASYKPATP